MYRLAFYSMARPRIAVRHRDAVVYDSWLSSNALKQQINQRTLQQYRSEVVRFLNAHQSIPLAQVDEETIIDYRRTLKSSVKRRMTSALGLFFQHALDSRCVAYNPIYRTKRTSDNEAVQQSLMKLMVGGGFTQSQARTVPWVTLLPAFAQRGRVKTLKVRGATVRIRPKLRKNLEQLFRRRVAEESSLRSLLCSPIAS